MKTKDIWGYEMTQRTIKKQSRISSNVNTEYFWTIHKHSGFLYRRGVKDSHGGDSFTSLSVIYTP